MLRSACLLSFVLSCVLLSLKADMKVTQKNFSFAKKQGLPFYFVSAADGTNVVKVRMENSVPDSVTIHFLFRYIFPSFHPTVCKFPGKVSLTM